jgi:hypothetical protein
VWRHKVVIVKGQHKLDPKKQWDLIRSLDPETTDEGKGSNDHRNGLLTVSNLCLMSAVEN